MKPIIVPDLDHLPHSRCKLIKVQNDTCLYGKKHTLITYEENKPILKRICDIFLATMLIAITSGLILIKSSQREKIFKLYQPKIWVDYAIEQYENDPSKYDKTDRETKKKNKLKKNISHSSKDDTKTSKGSKDSSIHRAKIILNGVDFNPGGELPETKGYTENEAQATLASRIHVTENVADDYTCFNPKILKEARAGNEKNYKILQIKRLGHALHLQGNVTWNKTAEAPVKIGFEGFHEAFTIPMIAESVDDFGKTGKRRYKREVYTKIATSINSSLSEVNRQELTIDKSIKKIKDPKSNEAVSACTGYDWHEVQLIFYKGFVFYCNRGNGADKKYGIRIFKMNDRKKITSGYLSLLINRMNFTREDWISPKKLKDYLDLTQIAYIEQQDQGTGVCTYASVKSSVWAYMAIEEFEQFSHMQMSDMEKWIHAFNASKQEYKNFVQFDKARAVEDLLIDCETKNDDYPFYLSVLMHIRETVVNKSYFSRSIQKRTNDALGYF